MHKKRIFILGAGLAGLSTAWHLQKKGIECCVFEKESEVGGLCRSKKINGFTFDYDGHLLHFKHRYSFELVKNLLNGNLLEHKRSAWVYFRPRYIRYPFQVNLYGLPLPIIKECLLGFIRVSKNGCLSKKEKLNFLYWIKQTFGTGIAKHFMIPYNMKFWTIPLQKITCEWLDGFVPVPSLDEIVDGTIEESQRQFGYNARFWYPKKGGISEVPLALASQIRNIYTQARITEINLANREIRMASGAKERFDYLISTIPLPELPFLIKDLPYKIRHAFNKLRWNSIFNLNLGINQKDCEGRHWIYFPQKELCFFRIGFSHNFSSYLVPEDKSSLYVEVSYSKDKPIDKNSIIPNIKEDLKRAGLLPKEKSICAQDINDIHYGYPIYDVYYKQARAEIIRYLTCRNIIPCGRYGSWRYFSMDDAIIDGRVVAGSFFKNV